MGWDNLIRLVKMIYAAQKLEGKLGTSFNQKLHRR